MRDQEHRPSFLGQRVDHAQDLAHQLRIERRGRLVEQQHFRVHRQRAGDRDPLLLSAGKLPRIRMELVLQPYLRQLFGGTRARRPLGRALHRDQSFHDVLEHGHVREQVELLEHHAHSRAHLA